MRKELKGPEEPNEPKELMNGERKTHWERIGNASDQTGFLTLSGFSEGNFMNDIFEIFCTQGQCSDTWTFRGNFNVPRYGFVAMLVPNVCSCTMDLMENNFTLPNNP